MKKDDFEKRNRSFILKMKKNQLLKKLSRWWFDEAFKYEYSYHFKWMGMPIIQFPTDIVVMQELIWKVKPDIIIETGIARGGSLIFYASMLELIGKGKIVGIDIDIRKHNRVAIEKHPMFKRITMIEDSSINQSTIKKIENLTKGAKSVLVVLDSDHTHKHVLQELQDYSKFVTKNSYLVVFDTVVNDMPDEYFDDRPWDKRNNPRTAVNEFLQKNKQFIVDDSLETKLQITSAPGGFIKKIR